MTPPVACGLATLAVMTAHAADGHALKEPDRRNHCLAEASGQPSRCYCIRDADERKRCLATTEGASPRGYTIANPDGRNRCLADPR